MPEEEIIIVGDLHMRVKQPYFNSKKAFWDWIVDDPKNNENNILILLGDLSDAPKPPGSIHRYINDLILNRLKFKLIIILTGNHDSRRKEGNYLEGLSVMPRVQIIDRLEELDIEGISILALPHYIVQRKNDIPMRQYYESLAEDPEVPNDWDFIMGHFPDETSIEFAKGINLSGLNGKRIMGDIHTPSENFLGTPVINRKDEKGKDSRIATINMKTKKLEYIAVPKFLEFYKIDYEQPPALLGDVPYKVIEVDNAPSKVAAQELCLTYTGYLHGFSTTSEEKIVESSDLENFNNDRQVFLKESIVEFTGKHSVSKGAMAKLRQVFNIEEKQCDTILKTQTPEKLKSSLF